MSFSTKSVSLIASCVFASLGLAACGGSGSKANASASAQDDERQILNFVKCMREHGVNISTPNGAGPGPIKVTGTNPQVMEAAQKACQRYRPRGAKENLSPAERAAREDAVNKFAKCMREHGVEVQVPTRGGGAVGIQLKGTDPRSPAFQAAQKACEGYMPKLRRAGRTAGPGSGLGGGPRTESSSPPASGSPAGSSLTLGAGK